MLQNRDDFIGWLNDMLPINNLYLTQSSGSYLKEIQELESLLRPMWGTLPKYVEQPNKLLEDEKIREFVTYVEKRKLPAISTSNRQIAVELSVIGYALGRYKKDFLSLFRKNTQVYFISWLNKINEIEFPEGNWYFFLVLINGALKEMDLSYSKERLEYAKQKIDSFYLGNGWYSDGKNQQRDYYIAFAFHFYGLLYSDYSNDPQGDIYRKRAVLFAEDFKYWFDESGRSIPFGRSLTYRFAHCCFWSCLLITGEYLNTSISLGEIKGLILNHLNFWNTQPITFPVVNNLSIGYGYSNLTMSEDYNSPGSPMWALKAFIFLELPAEHPFWSEGIQKIKTAPKPTLQYHPGFHICCSKKQVVALSNRQFSKNPNLFHHYEKYGKFAYSSYFGFNISRDSIGLESFAADSTLGISIKNHNQYTARGKINQFNMYEDYGVSFWKTWDSVLITTYLIPINESAHIRIHEIDTPYEIDTVEGGFPLFSWNHKYNQAKQKIIECCLENEYGVSKIRDLNENRKATYLSQGPNSNIYSPEKNAIPVLKSSFKPGKHVLIALVEGSPSKEKKLSISVNNLQDYYEVISEKKIKIMKENFND